jgi:glutathione S-transferase
MQLYIGNKNYSSWSMRPWVLMKQAGIPFEEVLVNFDSFDAGSKFKSVISKVNPVGKVPVLVDDEIVIWDSLAIAEYLAESFPHKELWPADTRARARARSICAEMHAGFGGIRNHFSMNIEARLPEVGAKVLREQSGVQAEVDRLVGMWTGLLKEYGGPLLFGKFSIADAYFAPVATRLLTYGVPVPTEVSGYIERVLALPAAAEWIQGALAEENFLDFEEPYRKSRA